MEHLFKPDLEEGRQGLTIARSQFGKSLPAILASRFDLDDAVAEEGALQPISD
jgi:hypothetical protein